MSFFDLFTPDTVNKTVDGIYNGVDKAIYTDEERADNIKERINQKTESLQHYTPFKIAQRYIALLFSVNFVLSFWVAVGVLVMGNKTSLNDFLHLADSFKLGWIIVTIVGFYFAGGFANTFVNPFTNKAQK